MQAIHWFFALVNISEIKVITWTVFVQVAPLRLPEKERINMFDGQMEMSFGRSNQFGSHRQRKQSRAQWWFQRMRQIVDRATDWQSAPPPRPVQIWFPVAEGRFNTKVEVQVGAHSTKGMDERQICE